MIDRIITFDEENYDKAIICEYFWTTTEMLNFLFTTLHAVVVLPSL